MHDQLKIACQAAQKTLWSGLVLLAVSMTTLAQDAPPAPDDPPGPAEANGLVVMDLARLDQLLQRIDAELQQRGNQWLLQVGPRQVLVVADGRANRMRAMSPIIGIENIPDEALARMLQANFDSALDARYAIAQDQAWSVFLHPLATLQMHDLLSGIVQVVTAAETFGTSFSSGAMVFGGGDSNEENQKLLEGLKEKLREPGT